jgi:hypothetical protein
MRLMSGSMPAVEKHGAPMAVLLPLVALLCATVYEVAFALGVLEIGTLPGQGPPGSGIALLAGLLSMAVGAVLTAGYAILSRYPGALAAILAPLAAGFVTARFYTFDPYYAPAERRIADGGVISESWILLLIAGAIVAALLTRLQPPLGLAITSLVMTLSLVTAIGQSAGH